MTQKAKVILNGLCYLAHPATTYGKLEENIKSSVQIQNRLGELYGASIVNPLITIGQNLSWELCMEQCHKLLNVCECLILSPKWYLSRGCRQEVIWAIEDNKLAYVYNTETEKLSAISRDELEQTISTKEVYNDENINIKHDDNLLYINYFGSRYTFSKNTKQIITPDNDDALKSNVNPEDYLESIGRGIQLYSQLPEEYISLLSGGMDYSFFFGKENQLCLRSDRENECIYLNKYNAWVLFQILLAFGNSNSKFIKDCSFVFDSRTESKNVTTFFYYVNPGGHKIVLDCEASLIKVYYDTKMKSVIISKDGRHFGLTNLETLYLLRLLDINLPSHMLIHSA
ncbi:MAG: hypothetical protein K0R00_147 [Herbinix sp.]|jgi:hypothetical protein|nr:hypothetical protein [Herbinix sp.]